MQIPWAANAYDFAVLMGEVFSALKASPSAEDILKEATDFESREGVGGKYVFVNSNKLGKYFEYPIGVYKVINNGYVLAAL